MMPRGMAAVFGLILLSGCVETVTRSSPARFLPPEREENRSILDPVDVSATLGVIALGTVEYDDDGIPLVSPDGEHLAVRLGPPPSWSTALAEPDASVPAESVIRVHRLAEGMPVQFELVGNHLLGRGVNRDGFLIEEPREDGTRRIGLVNWKTGETTWLVDDDAVNAFADIADDGTLAWSRRAVDDTAFELVIRRNGTDQRLGTRWDRSWLDPVIAADQRTVFALRRGDGTVELGRIRLREFAALEDSYHTQQLSDRVTPSMVGTILAAQNGLEASPRMETTQLIFRHPGINRLASWNPETDLIRPFPQGVLSATMLNDHRAVASTPDQVLLVELPREPGMAPTTIQLVDGFAIPRRIDSREDRELILLMRPNNGQYEISTLELFDVR